MRRAGRELCQLFLLSNAHLTSVALLLLPDRKLMNPPRSLLTVSEDELTKEYSKVLIHEPKSCKMACEIVILSKRITKK